MVPIRSSPEVIVGLLLLPCLTALLAGCTCGFHLLNTPSDCVRINFEVAPEANQSSAVPIDILVIYDGALFKQLQETTAEQWFDSREQFRKDYPDESDYQVWAIELVPGQNWSPLELPISVCRGRGLVFANYLAGGPHRAVFFPKKDVHIVLGWDEFFVATDRGEP